jgi:hypothetical protein
MQEEDWGVHCIVVDEGVYYISTDEGVICSEIVGP